ncbi:hypothetical protein [Lysobacter gummosus]|uniref:hypothetical protein n=1 Tax=Lysobacter gummosus TaxID=262324 RepID=UPI00362E3E93
MGKRMGFPSIEHTDQGPPWFGGRGIRRSQPGLKHLRRHYSARLGAAVKWLGERRSFRGVIPAFPSRLPLPRRRAPLSFGEAEHPEASASSFQNVIPAKAGVQRLQRHLSRPSFPRTRESSGFKRSRTKGPGCSAPPK